MDTLFFLISKIAWLFLSPDSLTLLFILLSLVLLYLGKIKQAKIVLSVISGILVILSFFPVGEWLLYPLENRFKTNPELTEKADGIIVLSGAEDPLLSSAWNQVELGAAAERNLTFMTLANNYPQAKLVFSGGTGSVINQQYKAADVAKKLFSQQGFDISRIIFERESRNTYENVINSKNLVKPLDNENWILITTSWHMPRSFGIFCKAGWPVIPYPVDHQTNKANLFRINFDLIENLSILKTATKEWLGLIAYYLAGKTSALYPKQCN
ncbi:MAG: YdcF family protein [Gammaproteobacteria bacterium]|nr:YdcF family protein [Gammaproteobacteria bacterium]